MNRSPRALPRSTLVAAILGVAVLLLGACGEDDDGTGPGDDGNNGGDTLNFYEQQLVGLWRRFHSYDGSEEYWRFDADRAGCNWEEASGSNTRIDENDFTWSIDTTDTSLGNLRFRVDVPGTGLTSGLTFDYPADEMWPTGFTSLVYRVSADGKTCS